MNETWYQRNKEYKKQYDKERRERLKDQLNELRRLDRLKNPEKYSRYKKTLWREHKEREQERNKKNYEKHKETRLTYERLLTTRYRLAQRIAKQRNHTFSITFEEYTNLIDKCYYCSVDLQYEFGYSLDRVDNSIGYTLSNVVPCCGVCNWSRADRFSSQEWKVMIDALRRWKGEIS